MEIRFQQTIYSVSESDSDVMVCVELTGQIERNVAVTLFTSDGSAVGELCNRYSCFAIT